MPQPLGADAAAVERGVDQGGRNHPTERRGGRQKRPARRRELAVHQLAFDLEPGEEEEDGHEAIVDPVLQVEVDVEDAGRRAGLRCARNRSRKCARASWPRPARRWRPRAIRCRSMLRRGRRPAQSGRRSDRRIHGYRRAAFLRSSALRSMRLVNGESECRLPHQGEVMTAARPWSSHV